MSNTAASTVTAPVDAIAWLLRRARVPVPENALGGSDWARQAGLLADVPDGLPKVAGETLGLLAPMMGTKEGAAAVAKGLRQIGANAAAPNTLGKQAGAVLADYQGAHKAPMKSDSTAALHELNKIYPDDIYSSNAARYYGHYGDSRDLEAVRLMQAAKGRPDRAVTIYRAVPDLTADASKEMKSISKVLAYKDKFGFFPMKDELSDSFIAKYKNSGLSYDDIQARAYQDMADKASSLKSTLKKPMPINNGDWVTLSKKYAQEHGESALDGKYKIVSKQVPARKVFTDANSIQEFGYDESGKALLSQLGLIGLGAGAIAYGSKDK
jgi:hypothetical protein